LSNARKEAKRAEEYAKEGDYGMDVILQSPAIVEQLELMLLCNDRFHLFGLRVCFGERTSRAALDNGY